MRMTIEMLTKHNPKGLDAFVNPDDFSKLINAQRLFGGQCIKHHENCCCKCGVRK